MFFKQKKKILIALLYANLCIGCLYFLSPVAVANTGAYGTIDLDSPVDFQNSSNMIYKLDKTDVSLRSLLRELAGIGKVNIILDSSVQGAISLTLDDVSVKEAFNYVRSIAGLTYFQKGKNLILVTTSEAAKDKGLLKTSSKIIPIKYINAKFVEALLNNTVFKQSSTTQQAASKVATSEFRTNSIILVGDDNDIRLAQEFIAEFDIPRETRTFKIHNANAIEVAQLLQASIFNDGISPFDASPTATGALPSNPTPVTVNYESYQEGAGAATQVQGASGASGTSSQQQTYTLRTKVMQEKEIKVSPEGPIIVPDSRTNTVTIMGTVEQIQLASSIIPTLDQRLPQVAIETSLIEIFEKGLRNLKPIIGSSDGQFALGFNNSQVLSPVAEAGDPGIPYRDPDVGGRGLEYNIIGLPTVRDSGQEGAQFAWTTQPIERSSQVIAQLDAILAKRHGKLLANPTVIAVHNSEAVISITEEIIRTSTVTIDSTGFAQTQTEIGEAGIILNILPKVSSDGYINLRIRPSVSTVAGQVIDRFQNITTLLNRRDLAVQEVRIANGQTLALGGLISETSVSKNALVPGLGNLPIIGALFRTHDKNLSKSELIILVTPHILEDAQPMAMSKLSTLMQKPEFQEMSAKRSLGRNSYNK